MKQPVQAESDKAPENPASARSRRTPQVAPGGRLAQLASMMNDSPRVTALAQMKEDIQRSPQYLTNLAAEINHAAPAQLRSVPTTVAQMIGAGEEIPTLETQTHAHFQENLQANQEAEHTVYGNRVMALYELGERDPRKQLFINALGAITKKQIYALSKEGFDAIRTHMKSNRGAIPEEKIEELFESKSGRQAATEIGMDKSDQANAFLERRKNVAIKSVPNSTEKKNLTKALYGTEFVKKYVDELNGIYGKGYTPPRIGDDSQPKEAEWKDKIKLHESKITYHTDEGSGYQPFDPGAVTQSLQVADMIIKKLVAPEVLRMLPAPQIHIVSITGHRAFQAGNFISVAIDDPPDVIVHEIGHYLEQHLPAELFHDAALLREKRAAEATLFGNPRIAVQGPKGLEKEGRYKGAYPATGEYTSKVYERSGATEVVSMTMEYLSHPKKLETLLVDDPVQASIVLRRIQPNDEQLQRIFEEFKNFLPFNYTPKAAPAEEPADAWTAPFRVPLLADKRN